MKPHRNFKMASLLRNARFFSRNAKSSVAVNTKKASSPSIREINVERRIEELNITLPSPSQPKANYNIVCHAAGNMLYISGHLPIKADGELCVGRVGPDGSDEKNGVKEGYEAARHCGLNIISTLKDQLGDLDRVEQIVKVRRMMHQLYCMENHLGFEFEPRKDNALSLESRMDIE